MEYSDSELYSWADCQGFFSYIQENSFLNTLPPSRISFFLVQLFYEIHLF